MKLLLDTHVFLWVVESPERLPPRLLAIVEDATTPLYLSVVSGFEIATKYALGKLRLPVAPPEYVESRCKRLGLAIVPLTLSHATAVSSLPMHHRDPFDRLLIAQAAIDDYTIATVDKAFTRYDIHVLTAEA